MANMFNLPVGRTGGNVVVCSPSLAKHLTGLQQNGPLTCRRERLLPVKVMPHLPGCWRSKIIGHVPPGSACLKMTGCIPSWTARMEMPGSCRATWRKCDLLRQEITSPCLWASKTLCRPIWSMGKRQQLQVMQRSYILFIWATSGGYFCLPVGVKGHMCLQLRGKSTIRLKKQQFHKMPATVAVWSGQVAVWTGNMAVSMWQAAACNAELAEVFFRKQKCHCKGKHCSCSVHPSFSIKSFIFT